MTTLISFPKELLRHICGHLPCQAALDFTLVCRYFHQACNDWTVWKDVVVRSRSYPDGVAVPSTGSQDGWKRYVIADAMASTNDYHKDWELSDLRRWLPQLAVVHHPVLQRHTSSLERLFDLTLDLAGAGRTGCPRGVVLPEIDDSLITSTTARLNIEAWTLAQAAAFCLAVNRFSYCDRIGNIDFLRKSVSWPPTNAPVPNDNDEQTRRILVARRQHTIGNVVAGSIRVRLKYIYTARPMINGVYQPPNASAIPLQQLMELPLPFTIGAMDMFGRCHIETTTDPDFLTSGDWTGSYYTLGSDALSFNRIGGPHHDGFDHPGCSAPPGRFPYGRAFEGVVRFRRVGQNDGSKFQLESNNFHSEATLHKLRVEVDRETGQLTIAHWHALHSFHYSTEGVMTPFGIVSYMHVSKDTWLWLWKVDWSAGCD